MTPTDIVVTFASALGGALVGAYMSYLLARRQEIHRARTERTLRLLEQYNSPELLQARGDAGRILRTYFETHAERSWNDLYRDLKDEYTPISVVEHFFQQVLFFHECREIDDDVAQKFFAHEYEHWYNNYFGKISTAAIQKGESGDKSTTTRLFQWLGSNEQL